MEYRKLGPTDLTVSALGFGCYEYGERHYHWGDEHIDEMAVLVNRAIDLGITCFHTAPHYGGGDSEIMLGKALGPRRKDVVIVTMCGLGWQDSQLERASRRDGRRESILPLVDQSLQRMQTDYIDVLQIHAPDRDAPFDESMGALDEVVQQGKVRSVGVSNFTMEQFTECEKTRRIEAVQYDYNILDRRRTLDIFPHCQEQNIGMMTWGSMAMGLLSGNFTPDTQFGVNDGRDRGGSPEWDGGVLSLDVRERNVRAIDDLKPIAERRGKTMAQLSIRWVLDNPVVSTALVGILNLRELEEDVGFLGWALSSEELREIDEVLEKHGIDPYPNIGMNP